VKRSDQPSNTGILWWGRRTGKEFIHSNGRLIGGSSARPVLVVGGDVGIAGEFRVHVLIGQRVANGHNGSATDDRGQDDCGKVLHDDETADRRIALRGGNVVPSRPSTTTGCRLSYAMVTRAIGPGLPKCGWRAGALPLAQKKWWGRRLEQACTGRRRGQAGFPGEYFVYLLKDVGRRETIPG